MHVKKSIAILMILSLVLVVYSCKKNNDKLNGTVYLDLPATPYNYAGTAFMAPPQVNQKATLGRVLFYDTHLSLNNAISCGSCHKQAEGFADNVALSVGYEGRLTKRNSKSISNITGDELDFRSIDTGFLPLFWDGREDALMGLVSRPITNHVEMGVSDFSVLPAKLSGLSYYSSLFSSAYGDPSITTDRISECVAIFLASIQSHSTRFDAFLQGFNPGTGQSSSTVYSPQELQGYNLFTTKYHCENCHHIVSNSYTTIDFKDIGLDKNYTDMGRGTITGNPADNGKFKVPSLRNVALTAPYMHDGRYKTLGEVIDHYSKNIQPSTNLDIQLRDSTTGHAMSMNIADNEKDAIIAFLNTFTDYQLVTDPKFSNPFKVKN